MLRIWDLATTQWAARRRAHINALAAVLTSALLLQPSLAQAATIDWNVAGPENYNSALDPDLGATPNWLDKTQTTITFPVSPPLNTPVGVPGNDDDAVVRNGGIAEITSAVIQKTLNVGAARTLYTDDGVSNVIQTEAGGNGTVNMTGGSITGPVDLANADLTLRRYGTQIRLGGTGLGGEVWTGLFNQSVGKINLAVGNASSGLSSNIVIGNGSGVATSTSVFTLSGLGEIGMVYDVGGHRGINVRNGTFNMTGGKIYNEEADGAGLYDQQFMQMASTDGAGMGPVGSANHVKAYANFSGGTVNVHHGLRVAPNKSAEGYVTISGTASLKLGNDLQLAATTGNATLDAAYGQLDMSGGYLQVGQYTSNDSHFAKKFIIGDQGRGVFTQTGGTVLVGDTTRMSNNAASSASFTMKDPGGVPTGVPFTFTTKTVETRQASTLDTTLTSDVLIDSPDATFIQTNMVHPISGAVLAGATRIGGSGKSTFEIKQGNVLLGQATGVSPNLGGNLELSQTSAARATLNLVGGKLTLGGNVTRADTSAASKPVINLTGGQLVLNPLTSSLTTFAWQTDLTLAGTKLLTKLNAQLVTNVGDATHPGNFAMNSGTWDLDIFGHSLNNADRIVVGGTGTGAINGGTLNLNYISGYTPFLNDSIRIVGLTTGIPTVNSGAVNIVAPFSPLGVWTTSVVGADIRLVFVPEPTSCVLAIMGLMVGMAGFRRRS